MKTKQTVPRNHVVIALLKRNAGAGIHEKPHKAKRRQSKIDLLNKTDREVNWVNKIRLIQSTFICSV
jgi:hypothetical protein